MTLPEFIEHLRMFYNDKEIANLVKKCNIGFLHDCMRYFSVESQKNIISSMILEQNGYEIRNCEQTEERSIIAVKQNGLAVEYIKNPTDKIYQEAIKQNGYALQHIKHKTNLLCELAVQQNGFVIEIIPKEYLTDKIYELVIKNLNSYKNRILVKTQKHSHKHSQRHYYVAKIEFSKINKIFFDIIEKNYTIIQYIEDQTMELCKFSLKQNKLALELED